MVISATAMRTTKNSCKAFTVAVANGSDPSMSPIGCVIAKAYTDDLVIEDGISGKNAPPYTTDSGIACPLLTKATSSRSDWPGRSDRAEGD
jgi:hypothetical protein